MRGRPLPLAAGLASLCLAGCPAFLSDPFHIEDNGTSADAAPDATLADATPDDATLDDAPPGLEGGDAGEGSAAAPDGGDLDAAPVDGGACCSLSLHEPLNRATFDHWVGRGSAQGLAGFTELTPEALAQAGAVFWPQNESMASFEVSFEFSITKSGDSAALAADGLAFVAIPALPTECEAGSNLCVLGGEGAGGFGVLVRTYETPAVGPPGPYVALIDTARGLLDEAGPAFVDGAFGALDAGVVTLIASADADPPDASWQTLCVRFAAGRATVKLDGRRVFPDVALAWSGRSYWGLVGATGSLTERNAVRNIRWISSDSCGDAATCAAARLCGE